MNKSTQDRSGSDLKKLYCSHVLENTTLSKTITGIDYAKLRKLKELNNTTSTFLKKYSHVNKSANSRLRRGSIDVSLARTLELNYNSRPSTGTSKGAEDSIKSSKSLGRDAINGNCPYSLDTWNKLVDSQTNLIEEGKRQILCDDIGEDSDKSPNSSEENLLLAAMAQRRASVNNERLIEQSVLLRRRTLEPLHVDRELNPFDDEALDAEIKEIQQGRFSAPKVRRHSVAVSQQTKLPGIGGRSPNTTKDNSDTDSDFQRKRSNSEEKLSAAKSVDDLKPLKVRTRRRNTIMAMPSDVPRLNFSSPVPEVDTPDSETDRNTRSSLKTSLKEHAKRTGPKPVANASVIVSQEAKPVANASLFTSKDDTPKKTVDSTAAGVAKDQNNNENNKQAGERAIDSASSRSSKSSASFLPTISPNSSFVAHADGSPLASKRVTFREETVPEESSEELTEDIEHAQEAVANHTSRGKKYSVRTATLKLLVDSHHGKAKLRYIAMLATEMAREEGVITPSSSPEPNPFEELKKCRYLRFGPNKENSIDST